MAPKEFCSAGGKTFVSQGHDKVKWCVQGPLGLALRSHSGGIGNGRNFAPHSCNSVAVISGKKLLRIKNVGSTGKKQIIFGSNNRANVLSQSMTAVTSKREKNRRKKKLAAPPRKTLREVEKGGFFPEKGKPEKETRASADTAGGGEKTPSKKRRRSTRCVTKRGKSAAVQKD